MSVMDAAKLRQRHPRFIYQGYQSELSGSNLTIATTFVLEPDITFQPRVTIENVPTQLLHSLPPALLDRLYFNLGLAELPSYWKAALSPEILVTAGQLSAAQQAWWRQVLLKGLGEFYFVNDIASFHDPSFVRLVNQERSINQEKSDIFPQKTTTPPSQLQKILIPLGGGKDSLVTLALLTDYQRLHPELELGLFLLNPIAAAEAIATQSGLSIVRARRQIDPRLLSLNEAGYLNGHTPFSAYLAFLSTLAARLFGYDAVALANERSANEGNLHFHGVEINHQWSKSYEFETAFQNYPEPTTTVTQPWYFSLLRALYELQIGALLAQAPTDIKKLLPIFRSCNRGQKTNTWCLRCAKCLFTYAVLYPFLEIDQMLSIFSRDLWADDTLFPLARDLLGRGTNKPLDCVGMYEESVVACYLSREKVRRAGQPLPILLALIDHVFLSEEEKLPARAQALLKGWNSAHSLPGALADYLQKRVEALTLPTYAP